MWCGFESTYYGAVLQSTLTASGSATGVRYREESEAFFKQKLETVDLILRSPGFDINQRIKNDSRQDNCLYSYGDINCYW